ncbi:hypothetical protein NGM10_15570 [Halorussus salilacus]|uniref:DUF7500 family protein n=1 Tax=Halorussus salilacus TaxID=2953750 RepID=UPI0020A02A23|nr:hypothetical protein [Halorussus salilacus]USZ68136.1 hypothetical protein NGM10_15570 [Halorussus salilacus]
MCPMPDGGRDADERSALSPDDLDIEEQDKVVALDQGRYVIGTDERPSVPESDADGGAAGDGEATASGEAAARAGGERGESARGGPADSAEIKRWLEDDLRGTSARYGFHISAKSEDAVGHQQMFSDDVGTVFDSLLRWYAQQLTTETAVEDVLGILLTESNVRVRYSPSCLQAILEAYDLDPDDTIADLFEAVQDDRGMVFPPENV